VWFSDGKWKKSDILYISANLSTALIDARIATLSGIADTLNSLATLLAKALRTYLLHRQALQLDHDALLVNAAGKRISTQGIARIIAAAAKGAGIPTRVTPHMIRHTVATLLLRCGADIRVVQEVLGHASIATTQRYTHVSKEQLLATLRARHPSYHLNIRAGAAAA